jgi:hypothetical protein
MKRKQKIRKPVAGRFRQIAQKLARAHTRDLGTTEPADRRPVEKSVQLLALYLPAEGNTIDWEAFDVPGVFDQLISMSRQNQERIALHLMGYYYWLSVQHLASVESVAEILDDLIALFPGSGTLAMLHQFSMIGLAGGLDAVLANCRSADAPYPMNPGVGTN